MKKVIGIGVLLQTPMSTFLFQERDTNTKIYPGQIGAFGGGVENDETVQECAIREMTEELDLNLEPQQLESLGIFENPQEPGIYVHAFLVRNIEPSKLILNEGKSIVELTLEDALRHEKVTDYTKLVLKTL